ncbi:MAG TPA: DbpA RNA binding domain-containing protein [Gemmatimonadales bacterium]|nr:DbpA RNA binding domain-containing protein [Gemmatimonadales bacterium]
MSESESFAALAQMGDAAATVERGHNLVAVIPPAAAYAGPAIAALGRRLAATPGSRALLLTPSETIADWAAVCSRAAGDHVRVLASTAAARAARQLRAGTVDLLITPPEVAVELTRRSVLKAEALHALILAWPEQWAEDDTLVAIMQDAPKDAQRLVCTARPETVTGLVERYARKALTVGAPPAGAPALAPAGPVRTVIVPWSRRSAALAEVADLLDPASMEVWCLDEAGAAEARAALAGREANAVVGTAVRGGAELVVAYDPPTPACLRELLAAGSVVLLASPVAEPYLRQIAAPDRPLRLTGAADAAQSVAATRRAAIATVLDRGVPDAGLLALSPLLERYDPAMVAAALYDLWRGGAQTVEHTAPQEAAQTAATGKVWVGIGKKEGASANDLVAVLTKEVRVDRSVIGRIELREGFCLVELPSGMVERVASGLDGRMIRGRKVTARADRGAVRPKGRPTSGGSRAP